jgi:precorrin-2 dehydrogenase / sirohydrochlorin ferrochelatase
MKRKAPLKLLPMFLKLENRPCLVVGAGSVAESKIASLVDTGAEVRVVAPEATAKVRSWAGTRKISWERRAFREQDLGGVFLVIAATSSPALHEKIFRESQRLGVLCNIVDVPHWCDFYYPAVVRRGALQIAVSTSGQSPALAQRLRKELEGQFGPEYEQWLVSLGKARDEIHADKTLTPEQRKQMLHQLVSREAFEKFRKPSKQAHHRTGEH